MPVIRGIRLNNAPEIDVLIPAIEKDLATLPFVIDHLRRYVQHPIGRIYIVSPPSSKIRNLCSNKNCTFVDEKTVLPITKKDINYQSARWDRSGWLYQQLLKMNGDHIVNAKHFLVIDADTILIRPHSFVKEGKTIFYCRDWSQPEYFNTYRKLLGMKPPRPRSFVTHYMLLEKTKLAALRKKIEAIHQLTWYKAIIRSIDKKKQFGFSEYETYANYLYTTNPDRMILRSSKNKGLNMDASSLKEEEIVNLARQYRSLSFHKRKIYSKAPRAKVRK
ncbi:DUF6492 family protein [Paenibacillus sp. P96]|uniref:DUF6492 family protein n=1 Tax=Paenibacillus zeirhizosphaerae TaxID=2987519 RepID=A0ABT9FQU0_9BACL|nr:DUF6492 family protein [Paenibacillus sp. P96]MDP4097099.1 DUF6492 family protein [Paenibacillus sp. P96]